MADHPTPTASPVLVGGRYRLLGVIDRGGMGTVHRAHDERLDRPVAVKVVAGTDPALAQRLTREARVLARLDHPNVVRVYDVGELEGRPCIVTEFVDGTPLHTLVARGPLPPGQVAVIGLGIARALAATHRAGVVHRDLKPANILLDADGVPRLLDYGVAAAGEGARLTVDGLVVGTPRYLSPEQATGGRVGPSSDVYSLGLVLIECLTGEAPFPGSPAETMAARVQLDPPVPPDAPGAWVAVLRAMTARRPDDRPSATAVATSLAAATTGAAPAPLPAPAVTAVLPATALPTAIGRPVPANRPARARRRPSVRALAAMAVAAAVLAGAAGWALSGADSAGDGGTGGPTTTATTASGVGTAVTTAPAPAHPAVPLTTTTTNRVPPGRRGRPPRGHQGGD